MDELDRSLLNVRKALARRFLGPRELQELGEALGTPEPERAYKAIRDQVASNLSRRRRAQNPITQGPSDTDATRPGSSYPKVPHEGGLTPSEHSPQWTSQRHSSPGLRWLVVAGLAAAIVGVGLVLVLR